MINPSSVPPAEMQQLVLVRQFSEEADKQLQRDDDFGNGQAVSMSQDAVELLIRIVVRARNITVASGRATLDQMADAIDKASSDDSGRVPHRERIADLNKARIGFKHTGTAPGKADAQRLVRYGVEFLETAFPRFFAIEYRDASLIHLVKAAEVREALIEADQQIAAGNFTEAMIQAARAVNGVEATLRDVLPPVSQASLGEARGPGLMTYLNGLRLLSLGALVGFDVQALVRFRALAPHVARAVSGKWYTQIAGHSGYQLDDAVFATTFALDLALAVQRRLAP